MNEICKPAGISFDGSTSLKNGLLLSEEGADWFLCKEAEKKANRALKEDFIVIVNESLVVKMLGKMSAVCTQTIELEDGATFMYGKWYSPRDLNSRLSILNSFKNGFLRLEVTVGVWVPMRQVSDSSLLQKASIKARTAPLLYEGELSNDERHIRYLLEKEELHNPQSA